LDTTSAGRYFVQVMARSAIDKIPPGPKAGRIHGRKGFRLEERP
jgi:hypothetical protein